jgi:lipopolysaccharide biosynthesis protein
MSWGNRLDQLVPAADELSAHASRSRGLNWRYLRRRIAGRLGWRAQEQTQRELIERSGLFDRAWYLAQFSELPRSAFDPVRDYIRRGAREGRNPNALFEGAWYLARYPDARAGINPLVHYVLHGAADGRDPGPLFDAKWYMAQHPELRCRLRAIERTAYPWALGDVDSDETAHLKLSSERELCRTDAARETINPLVHYLRGGWQQGALPFDPARLLGGMKVAVVVHLFYADLWDEIAGWLKNIPTAFDLFVSVPQENAEELRAIVLRDHLQAQVIAVPNVGRDVGAFFAVLPQVLAGNYAVLCKLHTKKGSTHPEAWRDLLLRGLLGNKMLVARILHAFAREPELALAGPREVYLFGPDQMTENRQKVERLTRALYPNRSIPGDWGFFAGTMFWARPDLFRPLLLRKLGCSTQSAQPRRVMIPMFSFENDNTPSDGQLAHAWERLFGIHARLAGKRIGLTEITGLHPRDGTIQTMEVPGKPRKGSFVHVLKTHALRLSGDLPFGQELQPQVRRPLPRPPQAGRGLQQVWWTVRLHILPRLAGFCIDWLQARLVRASPLFDRNWYLECYPDVRAAGVDPALHYVRHGAAGYRDPGPCFDTAWYLAYYSDVAASGINPLVHYVRHGSKEGRHARPTEIVLGEVTDAALSCRKAPSAAGEIALFVTHAPEGRLKPHVQYYLEALRRHGVSPVLIVATDGEFRESDTGLPALLGGLYVRQNVGYDFAAWAHVLRADSRLLASDILYLLNDSVIGPLDDRKFEDLLRRVRSSTSDVIGLTDSYERGWHIQSYFIALKSAALSSPELQAFIAKIKNLSEKRAVINAYETRLAAILRAAGLRCEVLFPTRNGYNPSLVDWQPLIGSGLPFVKLAALRNEPRSSGKRDWREILQAIGFDSRLAEAALAFDHERRLRPTPGTVSSPAYDNSR